MKTSLRLSILSALALLFTTLSAFGGTRLVISQMYGGGGNTGAPFTYDFLELYNPTSSSIDLTGYSIQYVNATGTAWNAVALPSATIAPGHYYLIQAAAGTTVTGINLPVTPDFTTGNGSTGNALNFSATAGKIAIVNNTTPLTTGCPLGSTVVALIGFGPTADCFEGAGPAPAPSNTTADIRTDPTVDTVNNATDFVTGAPNRTTPAPLPLAPSPRPSTTSRASSPPPPPPSLPTSVDKSPPPASSPPFSPTASSSNRKPPTRIPSRQKASKSSPAPSPQPPPSPSATSSPSPEPSPPSPRSRQATPRPPRSTLPPSPSSVPAIRSPLPSPSPPRCSCPPAASISSPRMKACASPSPR